MFLRLLWLTLVIAQLLHEAQCYVLQHPPPARVGWAGCETLAADLGSKILER